MNYEGIEADFYLFRQIFRFIFYYKSNKFLKKIN